MIKSAKRTKNERSGLHAWHPYYAGYSEAFVESALIYLECNPKTIIFDPWSGSGTTCIVAARKGISSYALDINPVMATYAAAKNPPTTNLKKNVFNFLESIHMLVEGPKRLRTKEPLTQLFNDSTAVRFRLILNKIIKDQNIQPQSKISNCYLDPIKSFSTAIVLTTLRRLSGVKKSANPTWILKEKSKISVTTDALVNELNITGEWMLASLTDFYKSTSNSNQHGKISAWIGNATEVQLKSQSVDRIITSPPYLTRIDYAVSTAPELTAFGDQQFLRSVRHTTTGSTVITKSEKFQKVEWGQLCNNLLDQVKLHPSKASESYYWKNMVQYFDDIYRAMKEISRVLKIGGKGLIVVQSSYYKNIEIPLGEIYVEMAINVGLSSSIVYREAISSHMAQVNTNSQIYKNNKIFHEDAVYIEKI